MGFFFNGNDKESIIAIFDIGSGSIGGAIVKIPTSGESSSMPTILKTSRTEIPFRDEINYDIFLADTLKAINSTANVLFQSKTDIPEEIFCVLASPWYLSETRIIKMSREHQFIFTKKIAADLLKKEIIALTEENNKRYADINDSPIMVENNIMGVSLNGYSVLDPIGKKTKSVEMNMVISLSPKIFLDKIKETLLQTYPHKKVNFSSFVVSSYLAIRDRYVSPDSYLLIDIGGEITDIGIVSKGILKSSISFPFGRRTFYKHLCDGLKIELRDAKELFNLFRVDSLSVNHKAELIKALKSIEDLWGESFRKCVVDLPHTLFLPNTVFLTADDDVRKWFVGVICNEEFIRSMSTGRDCNVISFDGPEFLNMCNNKDGLCDPFIMIEAIATMRKIKK